MSKIEENATLAQPTVSSLQALKMLERRRRRGRRLLTAQSFSVEDQQAWEERVREDLLAIFGSRSQHLGMMPVSDSYVASLENGDRAQTGARSKSVLKAQLARLDQLIGLLQEEVAFVEVDE